MMDLTLDLQKEEKGISIFNDPFKSSKVDRIFFWIIKSRYDGKVKFSSQVEFKNGDTSGKQEIEATDFQSLVNITRSFIESLN